MEGILYGSQASGSASAKQKGKQVAIAKNFAGAINADSKALPVLAVYKQKFVSITRALSSASAKLAGATSLAPGSMHDLKVKIPANLSVGDKHEIDTLVHEKLREHYITSLTTKVNALKEARNALIPAFQKELQDAHTRLLTEKNEGATTETIEYWKKIADEIVAFNDQEF
ncbi:18355_t:CDS:1, partial [Racocetra persica]